MIVLRITNANKKSELNIRMKGNKSTPVNIQKASFQSCTEFQFVGLLRWTCNVSINQIFKPKEELSLIGIISYKRKQEFLQRHP